MSFLSFIFGNKDNRALKNAQKLVEVINSLESEFESLSDEELKSKTNEEISKATGAFGIPGFKWPL